jgi:uncharacterized membrane protein HdeD (DUF308 family)
MREVLVGMWSTLLWRGALSIVFGISAFVWPGKFMEVLAAAFGIYVLVDGLMSLWGTYAGKTADRSRFFSIAAGVVSVAVGLLALFVPATVIRYLVLLIGIWNVYMGGLQILTAFVLRKELRDSGWQAFAGVISILFGIAIAYYWWLGVLTIAWLIGAAAIATGLILLWLGFKLRAVSSRTVDRV